MPNRVIKESIWTSPNLNQLSDLAERHFYRMLPLPDDFGCCELTPLVVKGRCYPLKSHITEQDIDTWQQELEEKGIIIRWNSNGREYGVFPTFAQHQRIRSLHQRKTPEPPEDVILKIADYCRQMSSNDRLNPNPNPILNHNHNLDNNTNNIYALYEGEIGKLTPSVTEELKEIEKDFPFCEIQRAFKIVATNNKRSLGYLKGILNKEGKKDAPASLLAGLET